MPHQQTIRILGVKVWCSLSHMFSYCTVLCVLRTAPYCAITYCDARHCTALHWAGMGCFALPCRAVPYSTEKCGT